MNYFFISIHFNPLLNRITENSIDIDEIIYMLNYRDECLSKMLEGVLYQKAVLDWDLKNEANVPIAGGVYIIHIDVPGVGQAIRKWFGVMRPVDLDNF